MVIAWGDLTSTPVRRFAVVGDGRGGCLVVTVLFCCGCGGDSFEEHLRCGPKLGVLVDLVELDGVGVTFKTVEALRGAFFFSTSVELNTKGAGGGGAGREMIDSNTSLPSILAPKLSLLFQRSALTDLI